MNRNPKFTTVAALLSLVVASPGFATGFTYDLRFAPGTAGLVDAHNVGMVTTGSSYTLQLWGQISGDGSYTNDGFVHGFLGVGSSLNLGGAFSSGGLISGVVNTSIFDSLASFNGTAGTITADGITDWGSNDTSSATGWMLWQCAGGEPPGVLAGSAISGQSQAVNANTWEVLLATFIVNVAGTVTPGASTNFNVRSGLSGDVTTGTVTSAPALIACVDTAGGTNAQTQVASVSTGVNFNVPTVLNIPTGTITLANANTFAATNISAGAALVLNTGGLLSGGLVTNHGNLTFNNTNAALHTSPITGTGTLTQSGAGTTTLTGQASYSGPTILSTGTLVFSGGLAHAIGAVSGSGTLQVDAATTLTSKAISGNAAVVNGTLTIASGSGVSTLASLSLPGQMDLRNNNLIVHNGTSSVPAMIITGAAGGAWTATTGLTSSSVKNSLLTTHKYGLGYATGAEYRTALAAPRTTFDGQPIVDSDELVMVTLLGDATMDGKVNIFDFQKLQTNYNGTGKTWLQGDFNYDNKVNIFDFQAMQANYNKSLPTGFPADTGIVPLAPATPAGSPDVPEPASLSLLALAAAPLLLRRKRNCRI